MILVMRAQATPALDVLVKLLPRAATLAVLVKAARRLGYTFLHYRPHLDRTPAGPWLMNQCGRLLRPLLFTRPALRRCCSGAVPHDSYDLRLEY